MGGLTKNDHEFPFLRIVELFERSLTVVKKCHTSVTQQSVASRAKGRTEEVLWGPGDLASYMYKALSIGNITESQQYIGSVPITPKIFGHTY